MTFLMAMALSLYMVASAHAVAGSSVAAPGTPLTIAIALTGAPDLIFKTSPQVGMTYISDAAGFSENAAHAAAYLTSGGQAYGMADDTNKIYWLSIETIAAITAVTVASSVQFNTTTAYQVTK